MKSKNRLLAVLLSLMITLTYMPAIAFAGTEDGTDPDNGEVVTTEQQDGEEAPQGGDGEVVEGEETPAPEAGDPAPEGETPEVKGGDGQEKPASETPPTRGGGDDGDTPAASAKAAKIGDTEFETLQAAIDAAHEMSGSVTITLLSDITEVGLIHQKAGLDLTIDGNGKTITGQIFIDGDGRYEGTDTLTIKDTKFVYDASTYEDAFICAPSTKTAGKIYTTGKYNYAHNIIVEGCDFAGSGTTTVAVRTASGGGAHNVVLKNNTVTGGHSFAQLTGVKDVTITGNTVTGVKNGINISGGDGTATITGNAVTADATEGYTVRFKGANASTATLEDNTFSGGEGLVNEATGGASITVNSGTYTGPLTGTFAVTGGSFSVEVPDASIPEGYECVKDGDLYVVREKQPVASVGEAKFLSLQAAINAAHDMTGDVTVTLLSDITEVAVIHQKAGLNLTFDGNGKAITGQLYIDGDGRYEGEDTLTIKDAKFIYDASTYDEAFIDVPNTKTTGKPYTTGKYNYAHNITVEGCEFTGEGTTTVAFRVASGAGAHNVALKNNTVTGGHSMAQLVGVKDLTITGNTVTGVKNGINISGGDGTATITGNTLTADATEGYTVRIKDASATAATLEDNTFSGGEGVVNQAKSGASITINSGTYTGPLTTANSGNIDVTGGSFSVDPTDYCAEGFISTKNADGTYSVVDASGYAAYVDGVAYATFPEAVAARADENSVITLLSDIGDPYTLEGIATLKVAKNGKAITVKAEAGYVVSSSTSEGVTTYTTSEADFEFTAANGTVSYKKFSGTVFSASGTYKLLKDITASVRVVPGVMASDVTLDLNGHTLTSTATDAGILLSRAGTESSHKTFALVDSSENKGGKFVATAAKNGIECTGKYNDVTIGEGVVFEGCVSLLKENQSLEVNGTINGGDDFAIATNGSTTKNATININEGASVTSNGVAVYLPGTGKTTVSGGEVKGTTAIHLKSGELEITGGTVTGTGAQADYSFNGNGATATGDAVVIDNCGYPGGAPAPAITGGTINSANAKPVGSYAYTPEGEEENVAIGGFVSGGTFNKAIDTVLLKDGFALDENEDGTFTVVNENVFVAKVGEKKYKTLEKALAAATDGSTVTLLKDIESGRTVYNGNASFTLDLDGKTVKDRLTFNGGTVTIKNGEIIGRLDVYDSANVTIDATATVTGVGESVLGADGSGVVVWGDGTFGEEGCKTPVLKVYGTITNSDYNAISMNGGDKSGAEVYIYDGAVVISGFTGIFQPSGNVTVEGGTITGKTGIYQKSGTLTITGGTITGNGEKADYAFNPSGCNETGDGVVIDNCGYPGGAPAPSITGGTIVSENASPVASYSGNGVEEKVPGFVEGGTFNKEIGEDVIKEGFGLAENADGTFEVRVAWTVTFEAEGGSDVEPQQVPDGCKATEPSCTREGKILLGWYNGNAKYDFNAPVTADLTLKAVWTDTEENLDSRLQALQDEIDDLQDQIDALDDTYATDDAVATAIEAAKSAIETAQAAKDAAQDAALEGAVSDLEAKITAAQEALADADTATLNAAKEYTDTAKAALQTQIDANAAAITTLQNTVATDAELADAVAAAQQALADAQTAQAAIDEGQNDDIAALVQRITAAEQAIAALETKVDEAIQTLSDRIAALEARADASEAQIKDLKTQLHQSIIDVVDVTIVAKATNFNTIKLTWNTSKRKVDGVTVTYTVYYRKAGAKEWTELYKQQCDGNGKTMGYTFKNANTGTTYQFYAVPSVEVDGETVTGSDSIMVSAKPVLAKGKIKKVKAGKKKAKVTFTNIKGATGYEIEYKVAGKKAKKVTVKASKKKTLSKTIKKLKRKKNCTFRVRAFRKVNGKKVYGPWSAKKKVKIK